jgi:hypothetical protein
MYLPTHYVPLFFNPAGYILHQAWKLLQPALVMRNDLGNCASLLKWLRVVTMGMVAPRNANDIGPMYAMVDLKLPLADKNLISHRQRILQQVILALNQPLQSLELAITQMVAAVMQSTNDTHLAREEKHARTNEPKLPSDIFNRTSHILLNYLELPDKACLPLLWHQWSYCKKKQ